MLASTVSRTDTSWEKILNDPTKWSTPRVWFLLHIWVKYPEIIGKYGLIVWGDTKIDISKVDLNSVAKNATKFEQEEVLKKIQLEIERGDW
jgi:hypothetical protein